MKQWLKIPRNIDGVASREHWPTTWFYQKCDKQMTAQNDK